MPTQTLYDSLQTRKKGEIAATREAEMITEPEWTPAGAGAGVNILSSSRNRSKIRSQH